MAIQMKFDELEGCESYFDWAASKVKGDGKLSVTFRAVSRYLHSIDFRWDPAIKEDEIRATDAMELRKTYAEETGKKAHKTEREVDRIWKSVHGKVSTFEVLLSLCFHLDGLLNEDEEGSMVPLFYSILLGNLGINLPDSLCKEIEWDDFQKEISMKTDRFLDRKYEADGSGGGLFPLKNWAEGANSDQRKVSVWYQMNAWLNENLDEEEHFCGSVPEVLKGLEGC